MSSTKALSETQMLTAVKAAQAKAYAPYSKFPVGAAIAGPNGEIFSGCNVENASYPEGNCAETSAIAAMVMAGVTQIDEIYVIGNGDGLVSPCGGCRQRIREFAHANTTVHICGPEGVRAVIAFHELLPNSFGPEHVLASKE
ncbi:cytidine deaminase, homotetrameric [Idiomarina sp. A28L]|uniref:cytidine deaminase n=1 Tax=Idiomarina sp. A28L TaxID=1036674 RepID=UPI0002138693|nr:cytidine deaminase [Idiomarina sp. A28L]EGN74201.1 cytidine deaminase, homotetrameric [Idiomarina sp. A28L]